MVLIPPVEETWRGDTCYYMTYESLCTLENEENGEEGRNGEWKGDESRKSKIRE